MQTNSAIYLGFWTNWSKGSAVLGLTLTMTRENGNFLIAFTALFVPFVASRFWKIFAIVFHQRYSTSNSRDAIGSRDDIYRQRQIALRNSSSPESALTSFVGLMWTWRHAAKRSWLRLLPVTLFVFCSIVTFTVAGGFSSQISSAGDVLLKGDNCQIPNTNMWSGDVSLADLLRSYLARFSNNIANYAKNCYSDQGSGLLECSKFVTRALPTASTDYEAPCPFASGICRRNNSNIRLDTGQLHSNTLFGMNARQEDTFTWRYVLQCAPLETKGRTRNIISDNHTFTAYNYGPMFTGSFDEVNYTYVVPDLETHDHYFSRRQGNFINESSSFYPDSSVDEHNGDVSLMFLSGNGVLFAPPTKDDWYRATVPDRKVSYMGGPGQQNLYRPDEAASPLGCLEQFQWCRDPDLGQCGTLDSASNAIYSAAPWFDLTSEDLDNHFANATGRLIPQTRLGSLLMWASMTLDMVNSVTMLVETLGAAILASQTSLGQGFIVNVPKNQWQLDVTQWWYTMLAGIQTSFVNTAQGGMDSISPPHTFKPATADEWDFCRNQKIRSTQYASFSVLGLVITYLLGALVIILSFIIEPILDHLQRHGRYSKEAYLEWEQDSAIQLYVQNQSDRRRLSHRDESMPIKQTDDILNPSDDIPDPKHPMLISTIDHSTSQGSEAENAIQAPSEQKIPQESS
ncbi:cytochrome p450 protein [Apiospora marii]|uniref:Cytochrome p450 protein n=1 Tax=Apiospora marii TaxID=335849 RepID=A0ABR1R0E4_9PEZI